MFLQSVFIRLFKSTISMELNSTNPINTLSGITLNSASGQNVNDVGKESLSVDQTFNKVRKTVAVVGGGLAGGTAVGILLGSLKYGATFPAKCLEVIGDAFGSIAALFTPFSIIGNEVKNYYSLKEGKCGNNGKKDGEINDHIFDDWREGLYRTCSLGFTPFIFEPFVNPEKFGKSTFHKIATVANIPNLLFSGYAWGAGNLQALLAWGLRKKEQIQARNPNSNESETHSKKAKEYDRIYQGCKRMAVIGSIANPTLQGLRQWADSMSLIFSGEISVSEFFEKPFLGLSRLVSLGVGLPELFAKGVDSIVRICKEKENLKPALPAFLGKGVDNLADLIESQISNENDSILKSIRHYAEIIFHTLSPLSMFALFAPLLHVEYKDEDIQAQGGLPAFLDKTIGRTGKGLMTLFTGLYITLGRLPQTFIECAYFGKKLTGKIKGKEVTPEELEAYKKKICNSGIVNSISNVAKKIIHYLVPDWYIKDSNGNLTYNYENENEHGYLTYDQIQANYSFAQAQEAFKTSGITKNNEEKIVKYCLDYVIKDANQGKHHLSEEDLAVIEKLIRNKINYTIDSESKPKRKVKLPFIGAEFLATYIAKLFDLKTMFESISFNKSSHHNMTTAYENLEKEISFEEQEGIQVFIKCLVSGARNTLNRAAKLAA